MICHKKSDMTCRKQKMDFGRWGDLVNGFQFVLKLAHQMNPIILGYVLRTNILRGKLHLLALPIL